MTEYNTIRRSEGLTTDWQCLIDPTVSTEVDNKRREIGDPKKNVWTRFNDAMMTLVKYTGHKVGRGLRSSMDRVGGQMERRINNSSPNTAYALKVMLICPTFFICHFWFLLAPYSDYTLLDIPLFVVRHGVSVVMMSTWPFPPVQAVRLYVFLGLDMVMASIMQSSYRMFQEDADSSSSHETLWWTKLILFLLLQITFIYYFSEKCELKAELGLLLPTLLCCHLVPYLACAVHIRPTFMAPVYYYLSKMSIACCLVLDVIECYSVFDVSGKTFILPKPNFIRDNGVFFCVLFYILCFPYYIISGGAGIWCLQDFVNFISSWCTTVTVLAGISQCLCILCNVNVALSRICVTGVIDIQMLLSSFDANIGTIVSLECITIALVCGVLNLQETERTDKMALILLVAFNVIIVQVWSVTEPYFLSLINTGERVGLLAYGRVMFFSILITTLTLCVSLRATAVYDIDVWVALNATGCPIVLSRCVFSFLEYTLVAIAWTLEEEFETMESAIYYCRILESLTTAFFGIITCYYRYSPTFLPCHFITQLLVTGFYAANMFKGIPYKEWISFQTRRQYSKRLDVLHNATEEELQLNDDVCSVCLNDLKEGKVLACGHIFHKLCLRKWLQVKTTCPLCSQDVMRKYAEDNNETRAYR